MGLTIVSALGLIAVLPARDHLMALIYGGMALVLFALHGIVAEDMRAGTALLWLQKPVSAAALYLSRLAARTAVAGAFVSALVILAAVLGSLQGQGWDLLRALPLMILHVLPTASLLFGLSAAGVHPDSLAAFILIFLVSTLFTSMVLLQPTGPVIRTLAFPFIFPMDPLFDLARWLRGEPAAPWRSMVELVEYCLLWLGVGCLALARRES